MKRLGGKFCFKIRGVANFGNGGRDGDPGWDTVVLRVEPVGEAVDFIAACRKNVPELRKFSEEKNHHITIGYYTRGTFSALKPVLDSFLEEDPDLLFEASRVVISYDKEDLE